MGYEIIDHTADIGIKVEENTMEEAFSTAAKAMYGIMIEDGKIQPIEIMSIQCSAGEPDQLLVDFLSELLYIFDVDFFVAANIKVDIAQGEQWELSAKLEGEKFDADRHGIGMEIKAVTYHMLKVEDGRLSVLFDV